MVPMRDGVRLATDIYRPTVGGKAVETKLPLLLHRTGYNKRGAGLVRQAMEFAARGYVVAVQDDRGTYRSEGVQYKYIGFGRTGTTPSSGWQRFRTPMGRSHVGHLLRGSHAGKCGHPSTLRT